MLVYATHRIEPKTCYRTILGTKFHDLCLGKVHVMLEVFRLFISVLRRLRIVLRPCGIVHGARHIERVMPIEPQRIVDKKSHPRFPAGLRQLLQEITLRREVHAVIITRFRIPHCVAIVVLRHKSDVFHLRADGQVHVILGIKALTRKFTSFLHIFVQGNVAVVHNPFAFLVKAIRSPVDEQPETCILEPSQRGFFRRTGILGLIPFQEIRHFSPSLFLPSCYPNQRAKIQYYYKSVHKHLI